MKKRGGFSPSCYRLALVCMNSLIFKRVAFASHGTLGVFFTAVKSTVTKCPSCAELGKLQRNRPFGHAGKAFDVIAPIPWKVSKVSLIEFSYGGLFGGRKDFCIVEEGDRIIARYAEFPQAGRERTFEVSAEDLEELERALEGAGVRGWFASYWNPVLDGTQWSLTFEGRTHEGSNSYPEGFRAPSSFLADRFDMPGCEPEECFVEKPG